MNYCESYPRDVVPFQWTDTVFNVCDTYQTLAHVANFVESLQMFLNGIERAYPSVFVSSICEAPKFIKARLLWAHRKPLAQRARFEGWRAHQSNVVV